MFVLRELLLVRWEYHVGDGVVVDHWVEHLLVGQVVVVGRGTEDLLFGEVVVVVPRIVNS